MGVLRGAFSHPFIVDLFMAGVRDEGDDRRRHLRTPGHWVGLLMSREIIVLDFILVSLVLERAGDKDLPRSRRAECVHGVQATIPTAEVADDPNGLGVGRPYRETHAADVTEPAGEGLYMRAERFSQPFVTALREQVGIELFGGQKEPVRTAVPVFDVAINRDDPVIGGPDRL